MKCHLLITPTLLDLRLIYPTYLASMSCGSNKVVCHELRVAHVSGGNKEARIGQRSCIGGLFTWRWRSDLSKAVPSDPLLQLTPPVPTSVTPCTSRGTNWIGIVATLWHSKCGQPAAGTAAVGDLFVCRFGAGIAWFAFRSASLFPLSLAQLRQPLKITLIVVAKCTTKNKNISSRNTNYFFFKSTENIYTCHGIKFLEI